MGSLPTVNSQQRPLMRTRPAWGTTAATVPKRPPTGRFIQRHADGSALIVHSKLAGKPAPFCPTAVGHHGQALLGRPLAPIPAPLDAKPEDLGGRPNGTTAGSRTHSHQLAAMRHWGSLSGRLLFPILSAFRLPWCEQSASLSRLWLLLWLVLEQKSDALCTTRRVCQAMA